MYIIKSIFVSNGGMQLAVLGGSLLGTFLSEKVSHFNLIKSVLGPYHDTFIYIFSYIMLQSKSARLEPFSSQYVLEPFLALLESNLMGFHIF